MSLLSNISIETADLKKKKRDIEDYLFSGQSNFEEEESEARRELYRQIKRREKVFKPGYTNADLNTRLGNVKDMPNTANLKDILCYLTISNIMGNNEMYQEAEFYKDKANSIDLDYYIDEDSDDTVDTDEERDNQNEILFSR